MRRYRVKVAVDDGYSVHRFWTLLGALRFAREIINISGRKTYIERNK